MLPPPYRIKVIEKTFLISVKERRRIIREAGFNPFLIPQDKIFIDLISDSGTSAMSTKQWGALIEADEAFSYQDSYRLFVEMDYRGRGAAAILNPYRKTSNS